MIKEAYVSFEVAKLLKEKGFNERTICYYFLNGEIRQSMADAPWNNGVMEPIMICAPTHQMALQWLREVHGIFIAINNDDLDFNWQCYDLINRESTLDPKILSESYAGYKTYEETIEAALKYTLENLI